jgi:hypothetical protein
MARRAHRCFAVDPPKGARALIVLGDPEMSAESKEAIRKIAQAAIEKLKPRRSRNPPKGETIREHEERRAASRRALEEAVLSHIAIYYGREAPLDYVTDYLRDCARAPKETKK